LGIKENKNSLLLKDNEDKLSRSKIQLVSTSELNKYQKKWFNSLHEKIMQGEPYIIANADTPHEIFHAMNIPVVPVQWWSAVCSAKQLAPRYLNLLNSMGYSKEVCSYCSLPLASILDEDQKHAPWGGLPKPTALVARLNCDSLQKIFQIWSKKVGAPFYPLENPGSTSLFPRWWEKSRYEWESLYESHRLDLIVEELKALIRFIEIQTGKHFSHSKFLRQMQRINAQGEFFDKVRKLIAQTKPCPLGIADQIPSTMIPQWHRGSEWALEKTENLYLEVAKRVDSGFRVCANEKIRLMWIGAGLWFNTGFYNAFEEKYGAVFVWSMYLPFASDGYIRYNLENPLRALASRVVSMNEQLHMPTWTNEWIVNEAKNNQIDAALMLMPKACKHSITGAQFTKNALEEAGIPTLEIWSDMVDARDWDDEIMKDRVCDFLDSLKI
jgi:benzoyl-CoA reductase/2-hydroxyglutaryl-CoA dehydratase subunit BcrC/BadD/HgdB